MSVSRLLRWATEPRFLLLAAAGTPRNPLPSVTQPLTALMPEVRRHPVIGHLELFDALTHEDMTGYHRQRYLPSNSFLVLSGDFDREEVLATLAERTAELPAHPLASPVNPTEPKPLGRREARLPFPIPVSNDNGEVGIEFKKLGVALGFRPIVMSKGNINLKINTEVSEVDSANGFTLAATPGVDPATGEAVPNAFLIPGLTAARA